MGAKLKSKTHLQNKFFDFFSRFLRVLLQSLQKVLTWPSTIALFSVGKTLTILPFSPFWSPAIIKTVSPALTWSFTFLISFLFVCKKNFLGYFGTFWKLWSQRRKKWLKKSKNLFCKCVLDFNFAPIKGSVFFIFFIKVKFVVP